MLFGVALAEWLLIIRGVLAFPKEVAALVRLLSGTPAERRAKVLEKIRAESDAMAQGSRPVWDE
jgi:hypothetical protein